MERVLRFARERGYAGAGYAGKWRGYECYEPFPDGEDGAVYTGLPLMILVSPDGSMRMTTPQEAMERLDEIP